MTEQGAAADNADRDGAPGGAGPFYGGPCVLARRTKLGLANPAKEPIARLLAPPGAPFPRLQGKRKKGPRARPGARKTTTRDSEALAERRHLAAEIGCSRSFIL